MSETQSTLLAILVLVVLGAMFVHFGTEAKKSVDEIEATCKRNGWRFALDKQFLHSTITIQPERATGWSLVYFVRPGTVGNNSGSRAYLEYRSLTPNWTRGRVVVTGLQSGSLTSMAATQGIGGMTGQFKGMVARTALELQLGSANLVDFHNLRPVAVAPPLRLTVLASDPPQGLDLAALDAAINRWSSRPRPMNGQSPLPGAIIGPGGFLFRLTNSAIEASDIVPFLECAKDLSLRLSEFGRT
ncbi:MAG: hypothetical protein ACK4RN_07100 [Pseudorhodobacter sp.]